MNIQEYIECINKAFEVKYPNKGFFVSTIQNEVTSFPIYKKVKVSVIHLPDKEEVFTFNFQDKVPKGKEEKFMKSILKEIVTTITFNMDKIWKYGERAI